ncbi:MAG: glycosyltransferase [Muribaculum sp.]|nr:glycosyltransferase [Muribaculum sp.]
MKVMHVFTLSTTAQAFFDGQFKYLSEKGYQITIVAGTEPTAEFCVNNKVQFEKIDIARRVDIKADLVSIAKLVELIKGEKFDAVVGHTPKGSLVAMCAAWLAGVKTRVYYRHGLIYTTATGVRQKVFKTVEQLTSRLATNIINVSPSLSKLSLKDGLNSDGKQTIIGAGTCGGIDTINLFNPALLSEKEQIELRNSILGECDFVIGFCGRLCRDKGIAELVNGFKLFKTKHSDIKTKLLIIGSYDERDTLPRNVIEEVASNVDIVAIGKQPKSKLPSLYSLMDIFVFPSYREGFGMSVIEASAMEVPILVSRSHGCIDSIREDITGEYIDISAESILKGIEIFYSDSNLRKTLGKNGRRFVTENFEQVMLWPKIKELFDRYLRIN